MPVGEIDTDQLGIWILDENALISEGPPNGCNFVLDTGATIHIFHSHDIFGSTTPKNISILTASDKSIPVSGVRSVEFKVFDYADGNSSWTVKMDDIWYVPTRTKNLVSGMKVFSKGLNIQSSDRGLGFISKSGVIITTASSKRGLFCFNTIRTPYPTFQKRHHNAVISEEVRKTKTTLIHKGFARIGHHLLKKSMLMSLKFKHFDQEIAIISTLMSQPLYKYNVCNS